jgi:hypothetical protein
MSGIGGEGGGITPVDIEYLARNDPDTLLKIMTAMLTAETATVEQPASTTNATEETEPNN